MNKYLAVFKTSFKQESKTWADALLACISFVVIIFIFFQLWSYIYGSTGFGEIKNGYTFENMLMFLIMGEVIAYSLNPKGITRIFANDVKSGALAYKLNKPYNYFGYQVVSQSSVFVWKLCFLIPVALFVCLLFFGEIPNFEWVSILPILYSLIVAVLINCLVYGCIGLLAFWIEDSTPFSWIIQKFVFLFGVFFPPAFFPGWAQPFIYYSPFYAMVTGPCELFAKFSWDLFAQVAISQAVYLLLFVGLGIFIYLKGVKKVNANGG